MKVVEADEMAHQIDHYVELAGDGPLVVTRNGKPVAIVLDPCGADLENIFMSFSRDFARIIQESRDSIIRDGGIPEDQIWAEFGLSPRANEHPARKPRRRAS
jgi:hypothetical protein